MIPELLNYDTHWKNNIFINSLELSSNKISDKDIYVLESSLKIDNSIKHIYLLNLKSND